ncbi:polyphosphate polymerase domain-containing protein [candidate division KSB1 bacterium]
MIPAIDIKKARYERKFLVSELDRYEVESSIKSNPAAFSEIFHERHVNNLYLDTINMESYHDNVIGSSNRIKVRIRWYGELFGSIKAPVMELKIKNNELGTKQSYRLNPFILDEKFSMRRLIEEVILKSNLPEWLVDAVKSLKFALLNRYKRRYFMSSDRRYRLTLDTELEFYRIGQWKNSFLERIKNDGCVILELKYGQNADSEAQNITNHFSFRLTKSSKYVEGIEILNECYQN